MLATPWPAAFDDDEWWFEVKWDGYRCISSTADGTTVLRSRRGLDLNSRFPEVASLHLPDGWVFDGEVVVFDESGRSDFSLLQAGRSATYVVFDVLESPAGPVIGEPLEERWLLLAGSGMPTQVVINSPVKGSGLAFADATEAQGLEGLVAKRSGSPYLPGRRSPDWRKIAHRRRIRAVVGGWLPGEGGRSGSFGSLLVGLWASDGLRWVGAVGSGFSDAQLGPVRRALGELERPTPVFTSTAGIPRGARWVDPGIVIEIEFKEWTRDDHLRAPVFKGVEKVPPDEVTWESERTEPES